MKNQKLTKSSNNLKLEKFQIASIKNLNSIKGGIVVPPTVDVRDNNTTGL